MSGGLCLWIAVSPHAVAFVHLLSWLLTYIMHVHTFIVRYYFLSVCVCVWLMVV